MTPLGAAPTHLVYLHGFRSSPQSAKAQQVLAWLRAHAPTLRVSCPQLPPSPAAAMELALKQVAHWQAQCAADAPLDPAEQLVVIGSSLGGFYATHLAERWGCRAVLLNPAIHPARDLAAYIGEQSQWHSDESFYFDAAYVDELQALTHARCSRPERILAVVATGDEVLDWREMVGRYPGSTIRLIQGGDHAISDFADHLDIVMRFLGVRSGEGEGQGQPGPIRAR
jgi:uncharacterized protein